MTHRNEIADATSERAQDYENAKAAKRSILPALEYHAGQLVGICAVAYWTQDDFHIRRLHECCQDVLAKISKHGDIPGDFVVARRDDLARIVSDAVPDGSDEAQADVFADYVSAVRRLEKTAGAGMMPHTMVNLDDIGALLNVVVTFDARVYATDYMVPGSPEWTEVDDVTVVEVEILGHTMPASAFPKAVLDAFCEYAPVDEPEKWGE